MSMINSKQAYILLAPYYRILTYIVVFVLYWQRNYRDTYLSEFFYLKDIQDTFVQSYCRLLFGFIFSHNILSLENVDSSIAK